jgi:CheY-like chemotaxis protein
MTYKILIVDDSKLARMSFAKLLASLRPAWQRTEAANAEDALAAIAAAPPDILVLDFNMPGRDGLDVAAEVNQRHPRLPVAVISANTQVEVIARAQTAGASFLPKPLTAEALAEFLAAAEARIAAP